MKHKIKHIHFIGIGGSGMSGLAELLHNLDFKVSGSDLYGDNATVMRLKKIGIIAFHGHHAENIDSADVVVTSSAIPSNNPEIMAAHENNIPVISRAQMLAEVMRLKQGIAIAGTHGKTTTTSLVTACLATGGLDPTCVVGGVLNSAGSNSQIGAGDFLVAEADESDASFLYLTPVHAVITNIDQDHLETYDHDLEKLKQAFLNFLDHLPFYGSAVVCVDNDQVKQILPQIDKPVITYGFSEDADYQATEVRAVGTRMHFKCLRKNYPPLEVVLNLSGRHNVCNAMAAIAIADETGVEDEPILEALADFKGIKRRCQYLGEVTLANRSRAIVIDDYGHHPTEIAATVEGISHAYPNRPITIVFQPHRYSRTKDCFEQFIDVLSKADTIILAPIYSAGEPPLQGISSTTLAEAIGKKHPRVEVVNAMDELPALVLGKSPADSIILVQGAGSIGKTGYDIIELSATRYASSTGAENA